MQTLVSEQAVKPETTSETTAVHLRTEKQCCCHAAQTAYNFFDVTFNANPESDFHRFSAFLLSPLLFRRLSPPARIFVLWFTPSLQAPLSSLPCRSFSHLLFWPEPICCQVFEDSPFLPFSPLCWFKNPHSNQLQREQGRVKRLRVASSD